MTDIKHWKAAELIEAYGQGRGDAGSEIARRLQEFDATADLLRALAVEMRTLAEWKPDHPNSSNALLDFAARLDTISKADV